MQQTDNARTADLIGDLIELSTALLSLQRTGTATEETLALAEGFGFDLPFERLTNNLRDGWRLGAAVGLACMTSSDATDGELQAAAPFAALLLAADALEEVGLLGTFDGDPVKVAESVAQLRDALADTVEELASVIAALVAGRVQLPALLPEADLEAAEAEAMRCDTVRAAYAWPEVAP